MTSIRQRLLLDADWRFHRGDTPPLPPLTSHGDTYDFSKAVRGRGPAALEYYDLNWETVRLPHDFVVGGVPDPNLNEAQGYLPRGKAWYRRAFQLEDSDQDKRLVLLFDGVTSHATVYVNGHLMARNFCGYTSFPVDITDVARFDGVNVVSVYVDADPIEGWFYEGGGINRHVWLLKMAKVAVDVWGVYVHPRQRNDQVWSVPVQTTVRNVSRADAQVTVAHTVCAPDGSAVVTGSQDLKVAAKACVQGEIVLMAESPALWDLESPTLYTLRTCVTQDGCVLDETETVFGFRDLTFDPNEGFFLNGRSVKIKGTANHQDFGPLGNALPDRVQDFRIRRLKDMGCNAYRCAHNPPAPELLEACDRLGMLVMDENRWFDATPEGRRQVESMVLRDRNHPSIFMWSAGNEEPLQSTPQGGNIMATLTAWIHELDDSRPVTVAMNGGWLDQQASAASDVIGMNYFMPYYDKVHALHPDKMLVAPETCAQSTTRGLFEDHPEDHEMSEYDDHWAPFGSSRRDAWRQVSLRPFVAGEFIWTGMDYRGETRWPGLFSAGGSIDPCCYPKAHYYLNKAQWTDEPLVHIVPHWNWVGQEGQPIRVWVYSNCGSLELLLNGRSLGVQTPEAFEHGQWEVPFEAGTLKAVGYRDGKAVAEHTVETTGAPVALRLRVEDDSRPVEASGEDVALITCYCVDEAGRMVPDAQPEVAFSVLGPGSLHSTFGSFIDHTPVASPTRRMSRGLCMAVVSATEEAGTLKVYAEAEGLASAVLEVPVAPAQPRPAVPPCEYDWRIADWTLTPLLLPMKPDVSSADFDAALRRILDKNSWVSVRVDGQAPTAFSTQTGWALYRVSVFVPPFQVPQGHKLVLDFAAIRGAAEIYVSPEDGSLLLPRVQVVKPQAESQGMMVDMTGYAAGDRVGVLVAVEITDPHNGIVGKVRWAIQ